MSPEPSDLERLLGPDRRTVPRPRGMALAVSLIAFTVLAGMVILRPGEPPHIDQVAFGFVDEVVAAQVVSVVRGPCSYAAELNCELVVFTDGTDALSQEFPVEVGQPHFETGNPVYLAKNVADDGSVTVNYYDRDRGWLLVAIALAFALAVILLGRMRGVAALLGLAISLGILAWFIVPAIIAGRDAMLVALVGGGGIVLISLYLAHGFTPLTHVAAIGAFSALALSTGLSWIVTRAANFTGLGDEEAFYLLSLPDIDLSGLLLAGIVLGAIGALDDVTVTQASAVWEVAQANPDLEQQAYFDSGLRIGRDHIASTVNTLVLAYAGAAMPLLILYSLSGLSLPAVASSEIVGVEIVRTLVGSLGLVASVPMTTWLAARQVSKSRVADS